VRSSVFFTVEIDLHNAHGDHGCIGLFLALDKASASVFCHSLVLRPVFKIALLHPSGERANHLCRRFDDAVYSLASPSWGCSRFIDLAQLRPPAPPPTQQQRPPSQQQRRHTAPPPLPTTAGRVGDVLHHELDDAIGGAGLTGGGFIDPSDGSLQIEVQVLGWRIERPEELSVHTRIGDERAGTLQWPDSNSSSSGSLSSGSAMAVDESITSDAFVLATPASPAHCPKRSPQLAPSSAGGRSRSGHSQQQRQQHHHHRSATTPSPLGYATPQSAGAASASSSSSDTSPNQHTRSASPRMVATHTHTAASASPPLTPMHEYLPSEDMDTAVSVHTHRPHCLRVWYCVADELVLQMCFLFCFYQAL
jgi:hypothetical protein